MADTWVEKPFLSINGVDYSNNVISIDVDFGRDPIENTAGGDGTHISLSGLKKWTIKVTLNEDYADAGLDDALFALADAGTTFVVIVRPSTAAVGPNNPKYTGTAIFDGPYSLLAGSIGELAKKTVGFAAAGTLVRAEA